PAPASAPARASAPASTPTPSFTPKTPFAIEPTMLTRAKEPPQRSLLPKILAVVAAATVLAMLVVTVTFRLARPGSRAPAAGAQPAPAASVDAGSSEKR
ncbi:MAG: hypothetical protein JNL38_21130, partial [Myxococcales bacterium]|nr:hypothetical protein [Myxococcales bacterium]